MARQLSLDEKLAIVREYYHAGKKQKTIARELQCTQPEVSLVLRQFVERGTLERQKGSRRPSVVTEELKRSIERVIKRKRTASGAELTARVARETGRRVSQRTIQTVRRRLGYRPVHVSVKPTLTDSHRAARLTFCREHQRDAISLWGFMDETGVTIDYHRRIHWIKQGECRPVRESLPTRVRSNIWAAVWWSGKTDVFITPENFNSAKYLEVLEANLAPKLPLDRKRFTEGQASRPVTVRQCGFY
jgi:transposase